MKRVLVIEDNERNFYLMKFMLEKLGCEVLAARDGAEGLALAIKEKPDLILLDIQLPVLDGYAVAHGIRSEAALAATPVIAVTSFAMPGDREKCLAAGCTGYMEKPIDPEAFMAEMKRRLGAY
jgi:CheY-like chemotaxis protein